jgi:hypothetical protein
MSANPYCPDCGHPFHGTDRCECFVNYGCSRDADCPGSDCCDSPCPCDGVES